MTKYDLVERVAYGNDISKKDAEILVETILQSITESLVRGEGVEIRGFGSFRLRERKGRKGRNPKTGEAVDVLPKRVTYFKPGKILKITLQEISKARTEAEDRDAPE